MNDEQFDQWVLQYFGKSADLEYTRGFFTNLGLFMLPEEARGQVMQLLTLSFVEEKEFLINKDGTLHQANFCQFFANVVCCYLAGMLEDIRQMRDN